MDEARRKAGDRGKSERADEVPAPETAALAPQRRAGGFGAAAAFLALNVGLWIATTACLLVAALVIGVWPAAALQAARDGADAAAWARLAGALAAPLAVVGLLHLSWGAFARAKAGRCVDWMLLALVLTLTLHAVAVGQLAI